MIALNAWSTPPAKADVGDLLQTVDVPPEAQCISGLGTSVAVVPGSMVDLAQPMLLVVSCFNGGSEQHRNLYFLDPSTNPATLAKTIETSTTPPQGWGSLALRGDKGDLLGCGNDDSEVHGVYAIDVSPFNDVADGTATFLFEAQPGVDICDGVAWDASDDTVFQSPDVADTIYHFSETGDLINSFAVPAGCPNSGLAVGGQSLFAACNGVLTIHQLDKTSGIEFSSFTSGGSRTEDLECDPVSFASDNVDVMWSKDAFDNMLFAFEIPDGTCGLAGGQPIVPPQCADGDADGNTDDDGDGLCDNWENGGIDADSDGTVDLQLYDIDQDGTVEPSEDADPNHKDLYLEIDYMAQHQPDAGAVTDVISAFANAPVSNPDGTNGIRLHIQVNEQALGHADEIAFGQCTGQAPAGTPDFDTVKSASFGTPGERGLGTNVIDAKRFAFRYSFFAHKLYGGGWSGCAELPGNDFVVTLGGPWFLIFGHSAGSREQQGSTLMHELGHTLNLRHGGVDNINCKPNYLSVMNYTRQFNDRPVPGRPLDYSRSDLTTLDEAHLVEPNGIGGAPGGQAAYGPPPERLAPTSGAVDWNRDGDGGTDPNVVADLNLLPGHVCYGDGALLHGHDDWANLMYDFQNTTDFADGVHLTVAEVDEITAEEAAGEAPVAGGLVSLPPARVLDTRTGNGVPAAGAIPAGGSVTLTVAGRGGVPANDVAAVVMNVTVTQPKAAGFAVVYPTGASQPLASNLNFTAGQTIPNLVTVKLGTNGRVTLTNGSPNTVHLIADVAGYYLI